jgi:hypothetical protein
MRKVLLSCLTAILTLLFLVSPALADDVFVSNKAFKGRIYGVGSDIRFSLIDLGQALDLPTRQTPEGWLMANHKVNTSEEHGVVWVGLDDLPTELVRVVRNREFGTIDIYRADGSGTAEHWGGDGTLVFFGASWCPTTSAMRATMDEIDRSKVIHVVYVDVEDMKSASYREYAYLFAGDKIPFYVLLDSQGKRLHSFFGFQSYSDMLAVLRKHL